MVMSCLLRISRYLVKLWNLLAYFLEHPVYELNVPQTEQY